MATIKIDDVAKQALTGVVNGIIDQFQHNALQQLIELVEKEIDSLVASEVKAYCESLTAYAEKSDSWWVKIRHRFLVSIISNSTDAITTAVKDSVKKLATEGIDNLQDKVINAIGNAAKKTK